MLIAQLPVDPIEAGKAIAAASWTAESLLALCIIGVVVVFCIAAWAVAPRAIDLLKSYLISKAEKEAASEAAKVEAFKLAMAEQKSQSKAEITRLIQANHEEKAFRETTLKSHGETLERGLNTINQTLAASAAANRDSAKTLTETADALRKEIQKLNVPRA